MFDSLDWDSKVYELCIVLTEIVSVAAKKNYHLLIKK